MIARMLRLAALLCLALALLPASPASAGGGPPSLSIPTPPDEIWHVIQGYHCGTHDGWGQLSFDLANTSERTRGAPVYAAADGTYWYWGASSGTLIISHGGGYYTMYTHMQSVIDRSTGARIARGEQVGTVGSTGADYAEPHLHFTFFYAEGAYGSNRQPVPLRFVEGYDFPDDGVCNNHYGATLTGGGPGADQRPASQTFSETGQTLAGSFYRYWDRNGGLEVFGLPLSAELDLQGESGSSLRVQYLERQRFELGADGRVQLGRLGAELLQLSGRDWQSFPLADPAAPHYVPDTGHAIAEVFWGHWSSHGIERNGRAGSSYAESLALFGYPLSEPQLEINPDGREVLTQWFERARFEYYPDNPPEHRVQLGRLGAELLAATH